jgi:multiple sugar transport system permease protein
MKQSLTPYFFLLPAIIIILALTIMPLVYSLYLSVTNYEMGRPYLGVRFVGLQNYMEAITDTRFLTALLRTFYFSAVVVSCEFALGLILALALNRNFVGRNFVMILLTISFMIAPVAVGFLWWTILDTNYGPMNHLVVDILHLAENKISWTGDPNVALYSIMLVDIWQYTPFMMLILLAGLKSIPAEPYEAALIDGASGLAMFRHITLPLLKPAILVALLIRIIDSFKVYDLVYLLTYGGPGTSSEVASFYIYLRGFKHFRISYASALSYIILVISAILITLLISIIRRGLRK